MNFNEILICIIIFLVFVFSFGMFCVWLDCNRVKKGHCGISWRVKDIKYEWYLEGNEWAINEIPNHHVELICPKCKKIINVGYMTYLLAHNLDNIEQIKIQKEWGVK